MQSKIRILSEQAINQIKAGEVIENPASVVKELVENAIDAKATKITIEINSGGRNLIRITDDGSGMNADDAILCLERHATSKIKDADDLQTVMTMGFRGEAIPSIASISKFSIITRTKDASTGTLVIVDGGRLVQTGSAASPPGTKIEVKSLFFNVPVRKKFQRSPTCDTNEILKAVTLLSLANPKIQFELISNEKKILFAKKEIEDSPIDNLKNRITDLLGEDFAESLCQVSAESDHFSLYGFISLPHVTRQNRTGQYLFINGRAVQNPLLSFAICDAYGTSLISNRHPLYVLHFCLPGDFIDVNVHPQKKQVRLRQEALLREFALKAAEKALQTSGFLLPQEKENINFSFSTEAKPFSIAYPPFPKYQTNESFFQIPEWKPKLNQEQPKEPDFFLQEDLKKTVLPLNILPLATLPSYILVNPNSLDTSFDEKKRSASLILVDQKRAHARILFEKFERNLKVNIHPLLIGHTFETTSLEEACLIQELEFLNKIGIEIDQTGKNAFTVNTIPDFLEINHVEQFLKDFISVAHEVKKVGFVQYEKEKQLALLACRHAISLNKALLMEEAKYLLKELMQCKMPFQDPKGGPIFAFIAKEDLKNFFQ